MGFVYQRFKIIGCSKAAARSEKICDMIPALHVAKSHAHSSIRTIGFTSSKNQHIAFNMNALDDRQIDKLYLVERKIPKAGIVGMLLNGHYLNSIIA